MTLATMRNNLLLFTPGLEPRYIDALIQRAYNELTREDWSWLKNIRVIYTTPAYTTGTVAITTGGAVTGVSDAWSSGMAGRWFKCHYDDAFFLILTAASHSLTLQDWPGAVVVAGTSYSMFKTIYSTYTNLQIIYEVVYDQARLTKKSQYHFDLIDPGRTATGPPEFWAPAGVDGSGYTQVEIYPPCDQVYPLRISAKLGAATLTESTSPLIPETLVESKALIDCFRKKATDEPGNPYWQSQFRDQVKLYDKLYMDYLFEDATMRLGNEIVKDKVGVQEELPQGDDYWVSRDDII